jgi:membrane-associated phospholipid phosphatase
VHDLDLAILDLVQSVHAGWLDVASSVVGLFGQTEVTLGIALGLAVARWRRDPRDALVPLFIVLTILAEAGLKIVFPQAPPPQERSRAVELIPFVHAPFAYSFPSGHVARASFLLAIGRGIPVVIVAIGIVLMALTRIYLGEHWFSDAVGGAVLGLAVAALARRITRGASGRLRA